MASSNPGSALLVARHAHRPSRRYGQTLAGALMVATLCACCGFAGGTRVAAAPRSRAGHGEPSRTAVVGRGRVRVLWVPAPDARGGRRAVWTYTPGVADPSSLPVLYFLTGEGGTELDLDVRARAAAQLDRAFETGRRRPFIVAAPDARSTGAADPEWGDSADGRVALESFVTGPLVRAVEGSRPRPRTMRAIAGVSMGGFGAACIAERHPGLYGQLAVVGGYFDLDDPDHVFGVTAATQNPHRPDRNVARYRSMRLLLIDGSADDEPASRGEVQRFSALLRADGQHPLTEIVRGYPHGWTTVAHEWPTITAFLDAGWGEAASPTRSPT